MRRQDRQDDSPREPNKAVNRKLTTVQPSMNAVGAHVDSFTGLQFDEVHHEPMMTQWPRQLTISLARPLKDSPSSTGTYAATTLPGSPL